jgi:hypothetical protein
VIVPAEGPRAPPSMKAQLAELGWPPKPDYRHVPGLPPPEAPARLTIKQAMGTEPLPGLR